MSLEGLIQASKQQLQQLTESLLKDIYVCHSGVNSLGIQQEIPRHAQVAIDRATLRVQQAFSQALVIDLGSLHRKVPEPNNSDVPSMGFSTVPRTTSVPLESKYFDPMRQVLQQQQQQEQRTVHGLSSMDDVMAAISSSMHTVVAGEGASLKQNDSREAWKTHQVGTISALYAQQEGASYNGRQQVNSSSQVHSSANRAFLPEQDATTNVGSWLLNSMDSALSSANESELHSSNWGLLEQDARQLASFTAPGTTRSDFLSRPDLHMMQAPQSGSLLYSSNASQSSHAQQGSMNLDNAYLLDMGRQLPMAQMLPNTSFNQAHLSANLFTSSCDNFDYGTNELHRKMRALELGPSLSSSNALVDGPMYLSNGWSERGSIDVVHGMQGQRPFADPSGPFMAVAGTDDLQFANQRQGGVMHQPTQATARFAYLPPVVQDRVRSIVLSCPLLTLDDLNDKVVSKLNHLAIRFGHKECLAMLDKMARRLTFKESSMKNAAGYLSASIGNHIAQLSQPLNGADLIKAQEVAKGMLAPEVYEALKSLLTANLWLEWPHFDLLASRRPPGPPGPPPSGPPAAPQSAPAPPPPPVSSHSQAHGIIHLLKKIPANVAIQKLEDLKTRSFHNVENCKGCLVSILSPKDPNISNRR
eukprot:gene18168-24600_t